MFKITNLELNIIIYRNKFFKVLFLKFQKNNKKLQLLLTIIIICLYKPFFLKHCMKLVIL